MRKIIGSTFVSLDGVMQAPGGTTEDWTGGFAFGGWLPALGDESTGEAIDRLFTPPFDLLLGRRTYDIFAAYWPYVERDNNPMGELFDGVGKYVVTRGDQPLEWQNSHRLDSLDALAELKRGDGPDLIIQGSSTLYPQLLAAGLLDRLTLMIFPVVLGSGKRLFRDGSPPSTMKMIDHDVSPGGNIIATYEPAGEVKLGTFLAIPPSDRELARQEQMKQEDSNA
ncbi:MAG: dihydrofolate reductase family protein [Sphingomonas sp.]|uniref:dihydrofolate reductase family protein n=1 Tax=Sphingomonas sp. TaxID=28214 RepID=UPI001831C65A|nr:dihydrofolate reductase family protein [Sphingomonas sp.]MBA3667141.1 dihydrofolate reductase family protein [Sphingomonas sp.]